MNASRQFAELLQRTLPRGVRHETPHPFDFLVEYGREFTERVPCSWRGTSQACFANARYYAARKGYLYCEGYACNVIPVVHAWCADDAGRVIDPTWVDRGSDYFGVVLDVAAVRRATRKAGTYSVLDNPWHWEERYAALAAAAAHIHSSVTSAWVSIQTEAPQESGLSGE